MEWIKPIEQLPTDRERCLGLCADVFTGWSGILEVTFERNSGWKRTWNEDLSNIHVTYWAKYPDVPLSWELSDICTSDIYTQDE